MNADLLIRRRIIYPGGAFAELVVWRVPEPVVPSVHAFKYRLVYVENGQRVIGFDNERGKGDHRHEAGHEIAYHFSSVEALLGDFIDAIESWRSNDGGS